LDRFGYPFLIHFELLTVRFFFIVYLTPLPSGCALSALAHKDSHLEITPAHV
jgi:hypothetical protein